MTRDYKNRTSLNKSSVSDKKTGISIWKWMLAGLIVMSFIGVLLWLKSRVDHPEKQPVQPQTKKEAFKYEFYNVLPEREMIIPEYQIETRKRLERQAAAKSKGASQQAGQQYLIQAGAFKSYREADKRKAQLILIGQNAYIEKAIMDEKTWHRVKLGPFSSLNQADQVRQRLNGEQIQSVIMKQK
ncbi:MAG: SPOR domain-containing protein [Gammaproteobacteria bacterium]|nr:SPOR domain-containing protein [Gammaproteobacteria bacterium]